MVYWLQLFWIQKLMKLRTKIPDTSGLVSTTVLNTQIGEVENKIPCVSGFVKKTDYDAKIKDCNKFTSDILGVKVKQKELVNKSDINKKPINSNKKVTSNKTKHRSWQKTNWSNKKRWTNIKKEYYFLLGRMYFTDDVFFSFCSNA